MGIKIHPRVMDVQKARNDIDAAVSEAMKKHSGLTYLELLSILNSIAASWIGWGIRDERHPDDPEKRAGEE
jgi:hypothetical protein